MSHSRSTKLSPRTWRAAVVVFLSVLLGGLGLSGAAALWSQQSTATVSVGTGTWTDYSQPGFSLPLTMATRLTNTSGISQRTHEITWAPAGTPNLQGLNVTYRVQATETGSLRLRSPSTPLLYEGPNRVTSLTTTRPTWLLPPESIRVTITPIVNGVAGAPTVKNLWLTWDDQSYFEDVP